MPWSSSRVIPPRSRLICASESPSSFQGDDPVELPQLIGRVTAVPGLRIHPRRAEQPDLVVVPQRANGHRAEPGELADAEHNTSLHPSPNVRVKTLPGQARQ